MIYQFKPGSHLTGNAQAVGERLARLEAKGRLTPLAVMSDARARNSPLHRFIEWDDAKAAHRYRLDQAAHLIRCVTVVVEQPDQQEGRTIRAFVPIAGAYDTRSYIPTMRALGDAELRKQVLQQAHMELGAVAKKYRELKELSEVVEAIDRVGDLLKEGEPA
jgi:ribonuclease D